MVDRRDDYIRPRGYYDNKGNLLNVGFDTINGLPAEIVTHITNTATQLDLKANKAQEAWITGTLENGWTVLGDGVKYAKNDLGMVTVRFYATAGTITALTTVFTLPAGYRPYEQMIFPIFNPSSGAYSNYALYIHTDGRVRIPVLVTLTPAAEYRGQISFLAV